VGVKGAVLSQGCFHPADRTAVDTSRSDRDKKASVETGIAGKDRLIALSGVQDHADKLSQTFASCSPFSDMEFKATFRHKAWREQQD
jgi:hypothetical protein